MNSSNRPLFATLSRLALVLGLCGGFATFARGIESPDARGNGNRDTFTGALEGLYHRSL
jgi:hypothetical protein